MSVPNPVAAGFIALGTLVTAAVWALTRPRENPLESTSTFVEHFNRAGAFKIDHGRLVLGRVEIGHLDLSTSGDVVEIGRIAINEAYRGRGYARDAMVQLLSAADAQGLIVVLTPSSQWGASKAKLTKFYASLGFVKNKGRKRDFRFRATMYREPRSKQNPIPRYGKRSELPEGFREIVNVLYEDVAERNDSAMEIDHLVARCTAVIWFKTTEEKTADEMWLEAKTLFKSAGIEFRGFRDSEYFWIPLDQFDEDDVPDPEDVAAEFAATVRRSPYGMNMDAVEDWFLRVDPLRQVDRNRVQEILSEDGSGVRWDVRRARWLPDDVVIVIPEGA